MEHAVSQSSSISEFGEVLLFIIGGALFVIIALITSKLLRPHRPNPEKLSTYESGEEPIGSPWTQFNIQFYIVALIFILFEVELVFLFPWATVFGSKVLIEETNGVWGWFSLVEMIIFIGLLALGLAYAWVNGFLEWVKPEQKHTEYKSPVPQKLYEDFNKKYS
jgi:NADH-quinone oxidoreductase subunit A